MQQCKCERIIGEHFSESGLVRIIREYTSEYSRANVRQCIDHSPYQLMEFIGQRLFGIYYHGDHDILVATVFEKFKDIECEPIDVPNVLDTFPKSTLINLIGPLSKSDVDEYLVQLHLLADEIRNDINHHCMCYESDH